MGITADLGLDSCGDDCAFREDFPAFFVEATYPISGDVTYREGSCIAFTPHDTFFLPCEIHYLIIVNPSGP